MKASLIFSLIAVILLSGCTAKVVEISPEKETQPEALGTFPEPQITSSEKTTQETTITTNTTVEVTKAPEVPELPPSEPKTYQVNVVQGMGVTEGAG